MARYVERNKRYYEQEIDAPESILRSCADGRRNSQFWGGTEKMRHTNWRRNLFQSIQPWTQARKIIASVKRLGYQRVE